MQQDKDTGIFAKVAKVVKNVNKMTETYSDAVKVKKTAEKVFEGQIAFGSLWEIPETVDCCRDCEKAFHTPKHNCLSCGGVFCADCISHEFLTVFDYSLLPPKLKLERGNPVRLCLGCRKVESPNSTFRIAIRNELDPLLDKTKGAILDTIQQSIISKVGGIIGTGGEVKRGSKAIKLYRGSYYGENGMENKNGSKPIANNGYFEIFNKSNEIFAIKLVVTGGDTRFEIPRPTYLAVPPHEAVSGFFDGNSMKLEVVILYANPHILSSNKPLVYDTRMNGITPAKLSPCARIDYFSKLNVYYINSIGKNVLLKYTGLGLIEPRSGASLNRVGLLGKLLGKRSAHGKIDYNTNVDNVRHIYSLNNNPEINNNNV